jgi:hypothetical protein
LGFLPNDTEAIMRRWNVFGRVGPEVNNPNQTMGMFLAEAYQKIAQLQVILNNDPMQMEFVEQQVKELFDLGAGLCLTGMIANSMNSKEHDMESMCVAVASKIRLASSYRKY